MLDERCIRRQPPSDLRTCTTVADASNAGTLKIYDIRLKSYRSALEEFQPSWDGIARRSRGHVSAGEYAARDLDDLNARYEWLVDALLQRIGRLQELADDEVIIITSALVTFVRPFA